MFINLLRADNNKLIHRVIPYQYFIELLVNQELTLRNPSLWDDPFENFLSKQKIKTSEGKLVELEELRKGVFGSCWTLNKESDFGWRVYSPNKDGILISMKISDLHDILDKQIKHENIGEVRVGKVEYSTWKKIKSSYEKQEKVDILSEFIMAISLFKKRTEFRTEREIRLIYTRPDVMYPEQQVFKVKFDVNKTIKSIKIDPGISKGRFDEMKIAIKKLHYKGKIFHSLLYSVPDMVIKWNNVFM